GLERTGWAEHALADRPGGDRGGPAGTGAAAAGDGGGRVLTHGPAGRRRHGELVRYLLADFTAQRRLHELTPYPRILVPLRDPVDRAYAAWRRARAAGTEPIDDFAAALAAEPARAGAGGDWAVRYAELGRYGAQLQRLHTLFSPTQILIIRYTDLVAAPGVVLDQACRFLGVAPDAGIAPDAVRVDPPPTAGWPGAHPAAPPELRAALVDLFRADILLLESLTRRSFGAWLAPAGEPAPVAAPPSGG
ncbi:MAG: sulfotransferase, partial [Frankia sp.]|nr:sulfotransferase [Frankia sp.]